VWGVEVQIHALLNSIVDRDGQLHASAISSPMEEPLNRTLDGHNIQFACGDEENKIYLGRESNMCS
jgi:hypothetical protein